MTKLTIKQPCLNRTTDSSVKSEFKTLQITILYRTEEYKRRREGGRARSACRQTERVKEIQTDRKRRKRDRQTEGGSEGETEAGKTNREEGIGTDGERAERKRQSGGSGTDRKGNGTTDRQDLISLFVLAISNNINFYFRVVFYAVPPERLGKGNYFTHYSDLFF